MKNGIERWKEENNSQDSKDFRLGHCCLVQNADEIIKTLFSISHGKYPNQIGDEIFDLGENDLKGLSLINLKCDELIKFIEGHRASFPDLKEITDNVGNPLYYILDVGTYDDAVYDKQDPQRCDIRIFVSRYLTNGEDDCFEDIHDDEENYIVTITNDRKIFDHIDNIENAIAEARKPITNTKTWGYRKEYESDDMLDQNMWNDYQRNESEIIARIKEGCADCDVSEDQTKLICEYVKTLNLPDYTDFYTVENKIAYPFVYFVGFDYLADEPAWVVIYCGYPNASLDEIFDYANALPEDEIPEMENMHEIARFPIFDDGQSEYGFRRELFDKVPYVYRKEQLTRESNDVKEENDG